MTAVSFHELLDERTQLISLTVKQYHQMIAGGILAEGEPFELIDGKVIHKDRSTTGEDSITVGYDHAWVVKKLAALGGKLERLGCHMQTQQPLTLPPYNEPEPDGAIIIGQIEDYRERHPKAQDVLCVIEVADASLRRDRTTKQRIYANSGIGQYVLINLPERTVEVYTEPLAGSGRYSRSETLALRQSIAFPAARGKELSVPARRLLP